MNRIRMPWAGLNEEEIGYLFYLEFKESNRMHWMKEVYA